MGQQWYQQICCHIFTATIAQCTSVECNVAKGVLPTTTNQTKKLSSQWCCNIAQSTTGGTAFGLHSCNKELFGGFSLHMRIVVASNIYCWRHAVFVLGIVVVVVAISVCLSDFVTHLLALATRHLIEILRRLHPPGDCGVPATEWRLHFYTAKDCSLGIVI